MTDDADIEQYLKGARGGTERRALTLAHLYGVDTHDLLSHAGAVVWTRWAAALRDRTDAERTAYVATVMVNHAKRLATRRRPDWACAPDDGHEPAAPPWTDPAVAAVYRAEELRIHRAIARMPSGVPKDVMSYYALGFSPAEIRDALGMSPTNFTTQLSRGRGQLRALLGLDEQEGAS